MNPFINMGWKLIPLVISFVFFLLFIAPITSGILNLGNIVGMLLTGFICFFLVRTDILKDIISTLKQSVGGKILLVITSIILILGVLIVLVINVFMIRTILDTPSPDSDATVIVLGCKVKNSQPSLMLKKRLESAYDYLIKNENANVVVSGGQGADENISEALCMKNYLVEKGISKDRIFMEDKSTSTFENMKFSSEIIEKYQLSDNIILVTDGYHQMRSDMIAKSAGFENIKNISAKTSAWLVPTYWVREWFGIAYYFVFD